jgi:ketosteroid isomerase-like protein
MEPDNKATLKKANAHVAKGEYEEFLSFCTEDTEWTFVGDQILKGKEAVRQYMATAYLQPPKFNAENLIAEGNYVTVLGKISLKDQDGKTTAYDYCDVWKFRDGKMAELKAFVIAVNLLA